MTRACWTCLIFVALGVAGCGSDSPPGGGTPDSAQPGDAPKRCSFETCDGCCDGDTCVTFQTDGACGTRGQACEACTGDETCAAGQCVPVADCSDCDGCCLNGTQCLPGYFPDACGIGGAACQTCGEGQGCNIDSGTCESVTCDASTCPNGCCTANGVCVTYDEQSTDLCGEAGAACGTCSAGASSCTQGTCVVDQPCLDICNNGCCTASGQCIPYDDQSASTCGGGFGPELCGGCFAGEACVSGACSADQAWKVTVVSATIAATKDGEAWDSTIFTNPLPDPYVGIALGDDTFLDGFSATIDNTLTPTWNHSFGNYKQSDLLNMGLIVEIRDSEGAGVFSRIGSCTVAITTASFTAGSVTKATCGYASNVLITFTDP